MFLIAWSGEDGSCPWGNAQSGTGEAWHTVAPTEHGLLRYVGRRQCRYADLATYTVGGCPVAPPVSKSLKKRSSPVSKSGLAVAISRAAGPCIKF